MKQFTFKFTINKSVCGIWSQGTPQPNQINDIQPKLIFLLLISDFNIKGCFEGGAHLNGLIVTWHRFFKVFLLTIFVAFCVFRIIFISDFKCKGCFLGRGKPPQWPHHYLAQIL